MSAVALRSKAHWGYDEDFLEACRTELTLDGDEIVRLRVTVAEQDADLIGFSSLEGEPPEGELAHLFVEPSWIGHGIGRLLWNDVCLRAQSLDFQRLRIQADPGATPFYEAMGARQIGAVPSGSIPERRLPLLLYQLNR